MTIQSPLKSGRRALMTHAIAWAAGALLAGGAAAQSVKPVTLLVPYPAGGLSDVIARMVEKPFTKASGQMAIVDNLGGASGSIAAQKVLNAPADGQIVYRGSPNELILAPLAMQTVKYRSEDWRMVQVIGSFPMAVLARKGLSANNIDELVALAKNPPIKSAYENVGAIFAGRTPKNWTLEELSAATRTGMKGRDYENGRKIFGAAACFACHRYGNAGGMNGPDLTGAGGRYSPHDLLDQIINPSKEINEQFAPVVVTKQDGTTVTGVIVNLNGDTVQINTDLSDPDQRVGFDRKQVKSIEVSKVSPMPPMLLSMLTQEEVLDLVAFVLSGGDKDNAFFQKK